MIDLQGGSLRDIGPELRVELCDVVGEVRGFVAGAGDGDIAEAGVEQIGVDAGVAMARSLHSGTSVPCSQDPDR